MLSPDDTEAKRKKNAHIFTEYLIITLGSWLTASSSYFHSFFSTRPTHILIMWNGEIKEVQNRTFLKWKHCKMNLIHLFFFIYFKNHQCQWICWWCWMISTFFVLFFLPFLFQMDVKFAVENVELTRGLSMNNRSNCQISCLNSLICTFYTRYTNIQLSYFWAFVECQCHFRWK